MKHYGIFIFLMTLHYLIQGQENSSSTQQVTKNESSKRQNKCFERTTISQADMSEQAICNRVAMARLGERVEYWCNNAISILKCLGEYKRTTQIILLACVWYWWHYSGQ
jgi:hypothetical protein